MDRVSFAAILCGATVLASVAHAQTVQPAVRHRKHIAPPPAVAPVPAPEPAAKAARPVDAPPPPPPAITVTVDDKAVNFTGTGPERVNGSVLVPLRGVFERLDASVQYHPATHTIEATRGATYLVMRVGDTSAFVNNVQVPLAQAAVVVDNVTLVPLRFVAQVFGATVAWNADKQLVTIRSASVSRAPSHHPIVVGQITAVSADSNPPKIVVRSGEQTIMVPLVTDTLVLLQHDKEPAVQAPLSGLIPGDHVRVTRISDDGPATVVSVHFDEIAGTLKDIVPLPDGSRVVLLQDGQNAQVAPDAPVSSGGHPISWTDIHSGALVGVRIEPQRKVGYAVTVKNVPAPVSASPAREVSINSFQIDAAGPLKGGDTLKATLRGTEKAKAEFAIPGIVETVPMTEVSPGVYQGSFVVPAGLNASGASVIGKLSVDGARAPVLIQAAQNLVIDSKPPVIANATPSSSGAVSNGRPRISATLDDSGGSGVDISATRLFVDGRDVTQDAICTAQFVTYEPKIALSDGEHRIRVIAVDAVGNSSELTWKFTINANSGLVTSLDSNLSDGNTHISSSRPLHVTLHAQPGGAATFSVGWLASAIPMKETSSGVYEGDFTPDRAASVKDAAVTAKFVAANNAVMVATLSQSISVDPAVPVKPTIASPKPNEPVPGHVVIAGTSAPNATVLINVRYKSPSVGDIFKNSGKAASTQVQADETGHWHTEDLKLASGGAFATSSGTIFTATAVVVDATGQQSDEDSVKFRQK
ncbi:MAG: copper amine oxidase N-terminal domain-containing protein [Capsulimonadaceae bacterium]|nr:copper amine oxidase N-terminal domain-containing protein [Capsulimonadaceae bacterium]